MERATTLPWSLAVSFSLAADESYRLSPLSARSSWSLYRGDPLFPFPARVRLPEGAYSRGRLHSQTGCGEGIYSQTGAAGRNFDAAGMVNRDGLHWRHLGKRKGSGPNFSCLLRVQITPSLYLGCSNRQICTFHMQEYYATTIWKSPPPFYSKFLSMLI